MSTQRQPPRCLLLSLLATVLLGALSSAREPDPADRPTPASAAVAPAAAQPADRLEIHFINVGQGDCTLVRCPGGETILIDCGSSRETDPGAVKSYLDAQLAGDPEIDLLVVTHPDADHYNLLPNALTGVRIGRLAYVGEFEEYESPRVEADGGRGAAVSAWFRGVAANVPAVRLREGEFDPLSRESDLCGCGDASIFVLAADIPSTRSGSNFKKNSRSIVILVRFGQFEALLTGDATFDTEEVIDERYGDAMEVEVLKLGHHGSRSTSTSTRWARLTSPEVAIASAAFHNTYGHPSATVTRRVARYTRTGPPHRLRVWSGPDDPITRTSYEEQIYSTATSGTIVVTSNGQTYDVTCEK